MRRLGPYELSKCIGAGGMAQVWLAQRVTVGASKAVAIKLLAPNLTTNKQFRDMFLEEARLSMLLSNSNIVQVFDAGEENGECFMAMEWIDGANLAELEAALWEAGSGVPVDVALYVVGEVLRALDYAHSLVHGDAAGIVHRDVSPANILVSTAGEVKLTDFGVARFSSEETSGDHVKGKLRYMPLEQLEGRSKEGTVDLYAVGAVLHELIEGEKFRGEAEESQLYRMLLQGVMPELTDPTRVPEQIDALRRQLLAPQVRDRIPSARAALELLRGCPGYRNAALELQGLVRWYRDLQPGQPGYQERRFVQIMPAVPDEQAADTSVSRHGIEASGRDATPLPITRRQQRVVALLLTLLGLGFGCFGVMFAINLLDAAPIAKAATAGTEDVANESTRPTGQAEDESREPSMVESAPRVTPEPQPPPVAEPEPNSGDLVLEDETGDEPQEDPLPAVVEPPLPPTDLSSVDPPVVEPARPEPPPSAPQLDPVRVTFTAGAFQYAYVKVAGKRLLIEPSESTTLPPGTHTVSVRFSEDAAWVSFGKAKIPPGRPSVVELVKPKRVHVTQQK